ncbi:hypothetical protein ACF0H5_018958 [Mactra antiquata]
MADRQVHLKFGGNAGASVDAYLEYKRIVGDDDGGVMFTPEQYEAYKKKVIPMRMKNRLFTAYTSPTGMDCKLVGPETKCFCEHKYSQHKTDFETIPSTRPILLPCKIKGCGCQSYHYVPPFSGRQSIKCKCKHSTDEHHVKSPYQCKKESCKCSGFTSSYTCGCGQPHDAHTMIVETKDERLARGHPIGQEVPYQAMGGLTGFSSLMEGYNRLDPSGIGAPPEEFLNQPITSSDHPFLRGNVESIKYHKMKQRALTGGQDEIDEDLVERMSAMKKPGESDMDFYERRYQERLKAEKQAARARALPANRLTPGKRTTQPRK